MDNDKIRFRRCEVHGCTYKEVRGTREGDFVKGFFVCPHHAKIYAKWRELNILTEQIASDTERN